MKKEPKSAWVKAMDYLARRDHSEKELIEKMSDRFPMEEILATIEEMRSRGWILPPEELAAKVTESLHRKNKGHLYILQFLRKKGLPEVAKDQERELEKARDVIESKAKDPRDLKRITALLKNRGFDTETIGKLVHEVRGNSPSLY